MIKLSVLIPFYNAEDTIIKAIESIPDRDDIEVVAWDDGSTDNSNDVAFSTLTKNRNMFTFGGTRENKGVAHAMNKLYDCAHGEYVVPLGADDYLLPDFATLVDDELDGTDMVYFDLRTNDGSILHLDDETKDTHVGSTKCTRREFLGDSRCPEDKRAGEDKVLYKELQAKKPTEKFTGIVAKHYNFPREGSLSDRLRKGEIE